VSAGETDQLRNSRRR